ENIGEKANVLNMMLDNPKIHPLLAFIHCGMFADPQHDYKLSAEYYEQTKADQLSELEAEEALLTARARLTANQDEEETDKPEEPTENGGEA
ncbi:MAG: hypothetical protein J6X53_05540, partial [Abditibacteriota bacterium]|nr:hypothetical protein [Abditibacteriota bacterium]